MRRKRTRPTTASPAPVAIVAGSSKIAHDFVESLASRPVVVVVEPADSDDWESRRTSSMEIVSASLSEPHAMRAKLSKLAPLAHLVVATDNDPLTAPLSEQPTLLTDHMQQQLAVAHTLRSLLVPAASITLCAPRSLTQQSSAAAWFESGVSHLSDALEHRAFLVVGSAPLARWADLLDVTTTSSAVLYPSATIEGSNVRHVAAVDLSSLEGPAGDQAPTEETTAAEAPVEGSVQDSVLAGIADAARAAEAELWQVHAEIAELKTLRIEASEAAKSASDARVAADAEAQSVYDRLRDMEVARTEAEMEVVEMKVNLDLSQERLADNARQTADAQRELAEVVETRKTVDAALTALRHETMSLEAEKAILDAARAELEHVNKELAATNEELAELRLTLDSEAVVRREEVEAELSEAVQASENKIATAAAAAANEVEKMKAAASDAAEAVQAEARRDAEAIRTAAREERDAAIADVKAERKSIIDEIEKLDDDAETIRAASEETIRKASKDAEAMLDAALADSAEIKRKARERAEVISQRARDRETQLLERSRQTAERIVSAASAGKDVASLWESVKAAEIQEAAAELRARRRVAAAERLAAYLLRKATAAPTPATPPGEDRTAESPQSASPGPRVARIQAHLPSFPTIAGKPSAPITPPEMSLQDVPPPPDFAP